MHLHLEKLKRRFKSYSPKLLMEVPAVTEFKVSEQLISIKEVQCSFGTQWVYGIFVLEPRKGQEQNCGNREKDRDGPLDPMIQL